MLQRLFSLLMVAFLSMTGCVHLDEHEYPENWPALRAGKGAQCPDISGTYENLADKLDTEAVPTKTVRCHAEKGEIDPPCLLSVLFSPEYKKYLGSRLPYGVVENRLDYPVEIKQESNGSFVAHVYKKDGTPVASYRHDIKEGRMSCKNGAYQWSYGLSEGMGGTALLFGSASHGLSITQDGSLVLELRGTAAGLVTIVPAVARNNLWYKWSRYEPN